MDVKRAVRVAAGALAIVAGAAGIVALVVAGGAPQGDAEGGPLGLVYDSERGCLPDEGSSKPYPPTGPMELSKAEKEALDSTVAFSAPDAGQGAGKVTISNQDALPATALFVDEDGRPRAKAFVRGGEGVELALPAGAYDVMQRGGQDWTGSGFGACSSSQKVKGIVVVEPGKSSHVVLYGQMGFVLGNRMDPEAAARLLADEREVKERIAKGPDEATKAARPEREARP